MQDEEDAAGAAFRDRFADKEIIWITLINHGYVPYCKNFLRSMAQCTGDDGQGGVSFILVVFCLDQATLLALRDADVLDTGAILLTAHDLHETPWGDGRQLDALIRAGYVGDAVLIPEYLNEVLPVIGRGGITWKVSIQRPGAPIHEVMRPAEPNVIAAGAELVRRCLALDRDLSVTRDLTAGPESLFIGQVHSGEIFNQYPQVCRLEGTRRWLPGTKRTDVERQFRAVLDEVAQATGTTITAELCLMRDAFLLDQKNPLLSIFQEAYQTLSDRPLPIGAKPFCDDCNTCWSLANVPGITHGPSAGGAHTLNEWVSILDLSRVAKLYALMALEFC